MFVFGYWFSWLWVNSYLKIILNKAKMKRSASHKTLTSLMSILLILSMVVSVFWAASMPLMGSANSSTLQVKTSLTLSSVKQHSVLSSTSMDIAMDCPASSDSNLEHCTTCTFIANMVGMSLNITPFTQVSQKESYPLHHGRLKGIANNVDLSPPKIG